MQTAPEIYRDLQHKLGDVLPDAELFIKAEVAAEVLRLKVERDAVILGHNYMEPALFHTVPDFQGDSLELSRRAAETDKSVIVFCGVRFMAETAKILNPGKTVLLPTEKGGCSLAESITAADVRALREAYPGVPIVTYINTYADVKAECDICCTSSNAAAVVESLQSDTVIFLPDEFLARNVARETGRHIIVPSVLRKASPAPPGSDTTVEHTMVAWKGRCEVHELFTPDDIDTVRKQFPDVMILAHPECSPGRRRQGGLLGQHDGDDQGGRALEGEALPAADRVFDGRQHRRRESRQGNAAPLQPSLPAHARDHARADAGLAALSCAGRSTCPSRSGVRALRAVERMLAVGPKID